MPGERLTAGGGLRVFDVTELVPGRPITEPFCLEANAGGPWFFQPAWWCAENNWGGSALARFTGYPLPYSPGFRTPEEAVAAAEEWEAASRGRTEVPL